MQELTDKELGSLVMGRGFKKRFFKKNVFQKLSFQRLSFREKLLRDPLFDEFGACRMYQGDLFDSASGKWVKMKERNK